MASPNDPPAKPAPAPVPAKAAPAPAAPPFVAQTYNTGHDPEADALGGAESEPNRRSVGVGGGGQPPAAPKASYPGAKMRVEMLVPFASALTVLQAGKVYDLHEEFAQTLLACDPPACTTALTSPNARALKQPLPDPQDESNK